jgi:hypothetical protein
VTVKIEGAGEGAEHQNAPSSCNSAGASLLGVSLFEGAGEGAESVFFPASNTICMNLSLASRFVAEIARVYTSSVIRELA